MRRGVAAFSVVFGAGLVLLLALGLFERRSEAFTLGVPPTQGAPLPPRGEVCQGPIEAPSDFERVQLQLGGRRAPVVPVDVIVRDWRTREPVATGQALGPFGGPTPVAAGVGRVAAGSRFALCVRNDGDRRVLVFGSPLADPGSSARYRGLRFDWDMSAVFLRADGERLLALSGEMVDRAALFRGEWIGSWTVWIVLALLVAAFPLLLIRALRGVEG